MGGIETRLRRFGMNMTTSNDDPILVYRKFNWRFWEPVDCIGGKVYLGFYYPRVDGESIPQTHLQFIIKQDMGICKLVRK